MLHVWNWQRYVLVLSIYSIIVQFYRNEALQLFFSLLSLEGKRRLLMDLREVNTTTFMLWSIPYQICTFFITWIGMRDRSTFRNCFRILTVLPWSNPLICFSISCLNEKTTEIFTTPNSHYECAMKKKMLMEYAIQNRVFDRILPWICWPGWYWSVVAITSYGKFPNAWVRAAPWFGWLNRSGFTPIRWLTS